MPNIAIKRLPLNNEQSKSEGFDSCDRTSNRTQIGFKSSIFQPVWSWNLMGASYQNHQWIQTLVTVWKRSIRVKFNDFLPVWFWNLTNHLYKTIWHLFSLLCCFELGASFHSQQWIVTWVTVRKITFWVKIDFSRMILKFGRWPWKTIGHLFFATSTFVHHFLAISELKLELQSENAQFGSKTTILFSRVTLKFDEWPWKTIGDLSQATSTLCIISSYVNLNWSNSPETAKVGFDLCDLSHWPLTLSVC